MKTLNLKALAIGGIISLCAISGAFAQNRNMNEKPAVSASVSHKDKADIREDLSNVNYHKSHLESIRQIYKNDKAQGNKVAVINDEREMMRAGADMKRDKMYLKADKFDLKRNHKLVIKNNKEAVKKDEAKLKETRKKGESANISAYQNQLEQDKAALKASKENYNSEMADVNKEIKQSFKESANTKRPEKTSSNANHRRKSR
jgi:hypothetical protein